MVVVILLGALVRAVWPPLIEADADGSEALVVPGSGAEIDVLRVLTAAGLPEARLALLGPLALWLSFRRRGRLVLFVVIAGALIGPINTLVKLAVDRARPAHEGTIEMAGLSFPSGHSAGAAVLAAVLVVVFWPVLGPTRRRLLVGVGIAGAVVVGYTRVALGAHFPSDVVAGWSIGVAWVLILAVVLHVWPGQWGALPVREVSGSPRDKSGRAAPDVDLISSDRIRPLLVVALCAAATVACSSPEPTVAAARTGVVPEAVELPTLSVRAPVEPVDIAADRVLAPPADPDVLGWWQEGRRPGDQHGAALLAGHTVSTGGGALERLEDLRVGDPVLVRSADAALRFEVVDVEVMSRADLTGRAETLFSQDGAARILLITCEDWDGVDWRSNVVVQATPVTR